jgi:hypothetical protein
VTPASLFAVTIIDIDTEMRPIIRGNEAIDNAIRCSEESDGTSIVNHIVVYLRNGLSQSTVLSVLFSGLGCR